jgi:uncharacterized radical SAM protein YgiQ
MTIQSPFSHDAWLPTTVKEAKVRGWQDIDVVLFTGDAYVDHPAFGAAVIGRIIEDEGLKIAIVPQPNWKDDLRDFKKFGKPNLFFAVTSGSMDSMVNHYTAARKKRSNDAYTPGGKAGFRPDYAVTTYCNILKQLYPEIPVIIGGVEASLRRFTHYDYWSNDLKPSILNESKADLLVYGMGEKTIRNICKLMKKGVPVENLATLPQVAAQMPSNHIPNYKKGEDIWLNSHEACVESKKQFAENFKHIETESNKITNNRILQPIEDKVIMVMPPEAPYTEKEMDAIWDLPFTRLPHPKYHKKEPIPAYEMIRHSINSHRGCFGGCSFCTISAHQGKHVVSRSEENILKEVRQVSNMLDFKGYISDIGGPSANMYKMGGKDMSVCEKCQRPSCIYPSTCKNLNDNHEPLLKLYNKASQIEGIKKITIGSGIRYDMLFDKDGKMTAQGAKYGQHVIKHHVSGRLKVAPEHSQSSVLKWMRKPDFDLFREFQKFFNHVNNKSGLKQQLIPYFISSHPGCAWEDMAELAIESQKQRFHLEQVQDFTPTPMTLATVMYFTGLDPYTLQPIKVANLSKDKQLQRSFFFWHKPQERKEITQFLHQQKRPDILKRLSGTRKNY